jgi:hypothetical protein
MSNTGSVHTSPIRLQVRDPLACTTTNSTDAALEDVATTMPPPPGWACLSRLDPGAAVAILLSKLAEMQRDMAQKIGDAEGKAEEAASAAKIQEMRDQADTTRTASYIQAGAGLAGALSCIPAVACDEGTLRKALGTAGKEGFAPGAKLGTTHLEFEKENGAANVQQHEGVRSYHARARDKAEETVKNAEQLADKAMQLYKEYLDAKNRCIEATILRM